MAVDFQRPNSYFYVTKKIRQQKKSMVSLKVGGVSTSDPDAMLVRAIPFNQDIFTKKSLIVTKLLIE